ncbi:MAG: hypothetical protein WBL23_02340 [Salinisphaera sp.]|uniref:hypothetical protein n=1 Tax=Salinisphaera sp. TaxID=1914330 RepID=UPI003C7A8DFA
MAVSTVAEHKPQQIVTRCMPFTSDAVPEANDARSPDTDAVSDGLAAFRALREEVASRFGIVTGSGRASAEHP